MRCRKEYLIKRRNTKEGYIKNMSKGTKDRNLDWKQVMELFDKQDGKCAISGIQMTHIAGEGKVATNISVDRILAGSDGGEYTIDNIRLVTHQVNIAINKWGSEQFIEMCKEVAKKN